MHDHVSAACCWHDGFLLDCGGLLKSEGVYTSKQLFWQVHVFEILVLYNAVATWLLRRSIFESLIVRGRSVLVRCGRAPVLGSPRNSGLVWRDNSGILLRKGGDGGLGFLGVKHTGLCGFWWFWRFSQSSCLLIWIFHRTE